MHIDISWDRVGGSKTKPIISGVILDHYELEPSRDDIKKALEGAMAYFLEGGELEMIWLAKNP